MTRDPAGVGSGLQNQIAEFDSQARFQDKWVLWPDGVMASLNTLHNYKYRSDDFILIVVTKFDEFGNPIEWYRCK